MNSLNGLRSAKKLYTDQSIRGLQGKGGRLWRGREFRCGERYFAKKEARGSCENLALLPLASCSHFDLRCLWRCRSHRGSIDEGKPLKLGYSQVAVSRSMDADHRRASGEPQ